MSIFHNESRGVPGNRGAPLFYPEGRTYSPPARRAGGGSRPVGQAVRSARRIALSAESASQCCQDCGPGHHCLRGGNGASFPPPAKTCTQQLYCRGRPSQKFGLLSLLRKRNRKRKYGGDSNWQYTTWKRRSSAEAQVDPHAQHRPI